MSIDVNAWVFSKRERSTLRPPADDADTITGTLNNNTSVLAPAIQFVGSVEITNYNYMYIPAFDRYYHVERWDWSTGLWTAYLTIDVLATWREAIEDHTAYVIRSSADYDGDIIDMLYPSIPGTGVISAEGAQPFPGGRYFIVQYNGAGGVHCVLMSQDSFTAMCQQLWQTWHETEGMSALIENAVDPFQYVSGVQTTPAGADFWITGGEVAITLGALQITASGASMWGETANLYSVSVPKHPQADERPFAKAEPFSQYSVKAPGVGLIPLSASDLYDVDSIQVYYKAEPFTGNCRVDILAGGGLIATANGKITTGWSIGANSVNVGNVAGAATGALANLFTGNFIGAAAGLGNAATSLLPAFSSTGSASGCVGMYEPIECILKYQLLVDDDLPDNGRPLMQTVRLGDIPGYIICESGNISCDALDDEREEINDYLTGGFFLEYEYTPEDEPEEEEEDDGDMGGA